MQDQVGALRHRGIAAAYVNSQLDEDQPRVVLDTATSRRLALLYCAPEGLASLTRRLIVAQRRQTGRMSHPLALEGLLMGKHRSCDVTVCRISDTSSRHDTGVLRGALSIFQNGR